MKDSEDFEEKFDNELRTFAGNVSKFEKASVIADQSLPMADHHCPK